MPTGFTAVVQDGRVTELEDFIIGCARGFGALITLRDEDQSLDATKRFIDDKAYLDKSTYYANSLKESYDRLQKLILITDQEIEDEVTAERERVTEYNRKQEEKRLVELARYNEMVKKVEAWQPPTADHVEFKEFMLDQLKQSIEFDCKPYSLPLPEVSPTWRDEEIQATKKRIDHYKNEIKKQDERNEGRRLWVESLVDSLNGMSK